MGASSVMGWVTVGARASYARCERGDGVAGGPAGGLDGTRGATGRGRRGGRVGGAAPCRGGGSSDRWRGKFWAAAQAARMGPANSAMRLIGELGG